MSKITSLILANRRLDIVRIEPLPGTVRTSVSLVSVVKYLKLSLRSTILLLSEEKIQWVDLLCPSDQYEEIQMQFWCDGLVYIHTISLIQFQGN